jgi:CDP-glucose 4,6-dehydratase
LIPGTIRSVLRGEPPVIRSDGTLVRDYTYVDDAADAYLRLADRLVDRAVPIGAAYNVATGIGTRAIDLARRILELMESDLACVVLDEAEHEIPDQVLDFRRARRELGWTPYRDLETGLVASIAWYREFFSRPPPD